MQPTELQFSIHDGKTLGEDARSLVIAFCPIEYWKERECLPDYYLPDEIENIVGGYLWLDCMEECCWIVYDKSREQVDKELSTAGYTRNKEQEKFLDGCWDAY